MAERRGSDVEHGSRAVEDRPPLRTGPAVVVLAVVMAVVLVVGVALEEVRTRGVEGAPGAVQLLVLHGARLFYVDAEANVWAWLSSLALAVLAGAFAASSAALRAAGLRWGPVAVLAAVALLLSADEGAMLHETLNEVGTRLTDALGPYNAWLIPGVVVVAVAGVALLRVARGLDRRLRRRLVVAGAVFLAGALGMEAVGATYALTTVTDTFNPWETTTYHLLAAAEEALEAAGTLLALRAALATVEVRAGSGGLSLTHRSTAPRPHRLPVREG